MREGNSKMAAATTTQTNRSINASPAYSKELRSFSLAGSVSLFTLMILAAFLMPFTYMGITALKNREQIVRGAFGPILPMSEVTFEFEEQVYPIYRVPTEDGVQEWAMVQSRRARGDTIPMSVFVDPNNPEAGTFEWEGNQFTLDPVYKLDIQWGNFEEAWTRIQFPKLLGNTLAIAVFGVIGTVLSSTVVAYGFARFPIPGKSILFIVLISTIILPRQVTLVPTYALFSQIGWTGTWLPLIVPHFFANAYNVFLVRQYFMTIPREMDESAMIDGAGPFRILISVILPQSWPVIVAVSLFHFVFAWNDYFEPLIYLLGNPDLMPLSVGIQQFNFRYNQLPQLIQTTALMGLVIPVLIFILAQRVFMRGVVITGVEK